MDKRIQIPLSLFEKMVGYIQDHYDPSDHERYTRIMLGIENKRQAEIRRNLYTAYKTEKDPTTKEALRVSYLDKAGIPSHGRWDEETERKFQKGEFCN